MNECINLRNLFSWYNTYTKSNIETLYKLKRIDSYEDKYETKDSCLLEDLFKNNKLEYINVRNDIPDSNIVKSMVLLHNIANLRFMYISQEKAKYDIKLNISNEYPEHIRLYDVVTNNKQYFNDPDDFIYGEL